MRILTLNIWNLSGPWRERRNEVVAWIDRLAPDVVCLQEVVENDDGRNQARWLADETAGEWFVAFAGAPVGRGRCVGNAVMSRRPIEHEAHLRLPDAAAPDDLQRLVLHARTGGFDVYCTHLAWRFELAAVRRRQVLAVHDFVEETASPSSPLPPIIAGDFNAEPNSEEIRFLSGLTSLDGRSTYYQDAWRVAGARGPGFTWDNRNPFAAAEHEPDRRIDYVFVGWRRAGGAGVVEAARVACDRSLIGTFASDHFGLCADLTD